MDAPELIIRRYQAADLDTLQAIRAAAFAPIFESFRRLTGPEISPIAHAGAEAEQAAHLDEICKQESGHTVFVAERAGRVAGFCSYSVNAEKKLGEIGPNAVHPDYDGGGIGTALYNHALKAMAEAGMEVATVGTGGDASHAPARRAYEKAGFGSAIPSVYLYRTL